MLDRLPGSAGDACVAVGDRRDVRSGGIGAGPFDEARTSFADQTESGTPAQVSLYFIPANGPGSKPGLTVTMDNTTTGATQTLHETTTADADVWTFFQTEIPVPAPGKYRIRATSGGDSGCFLVTFR